MDRVDLGEIDGLCYGGIVDKKETSIADLCDKIDILSENFERLARRLEVESERITACDARHERRRWIWSILVPASAGAVGGISSAALQSLAGW